MVKMFKASKGYPNYMGLRNRIFVGLRPMSVATGRVFRWRKGVHSHLVTLSCLVVDSLLRELDMYSEDLTVLVRGNLKIPLGLRTRTRFIMRIAEGEGLVSGEGTVDESLE